MENTEVTAARRSFLCDIGKFLFCSYTAEDIGRQKMLAMICSYLFQSVLQFVVTA